MFLPSAHVLRFPRCALGSSFHVVSAPGIEGAEAEALQALISSMLGAPGALTGFGGLRNKAAEGFSMSFVS